MPMPIWEKGSLYTVALDFFPQIFGNAEILVEFQKLGGAWEATNIQFVASSLSRTVIKVEVPFQVPSGSVTVEISRRITGTGDAVRVEIMIQNPGELALEQPVPVQTCLGSLVPMPPQGHNPTVRNVT